MDNKTLFKFLFKDISEIEELFAEKGTEGFDELEMEFIRTRFSGAKHIIQLLSEKDGPAKRMVVTEPVVTKVAEEPVATKVKETIEPQAPLSDKEQESLAALSDFEEKLKQEESKPEPVAEKEAPVAPQKEAEIVEDSSSEKETGIDEKEDVEQIADAEVEELKQEEPEVEEEPVNEEEPKKERESEEEPESSVANNRIGDRLIKDKSVNDLLSGNDDKKLEYKISNSPVKSIQAAIGINDRYQYIRELFNGSAESFAKTVVDIDKLDDIQQAVAYLQENFKWKKNETSLKFVNLVKRRFPNG
ncbi:hypothetical protein [Draconibacterium halophilum]|uniref:Uncharacterized protein n=1 Tax=Draconibacterium halophilum TaxID=2706887 RepID=A0A6C0RBA0_9BACT|nr:hypothetical protein [Draconibacterium halophilum]QIA07296.1 hypothetical protein G0Q07_05960 [Draconibacterium halophilum]